MRSRSMPPDEFQAMIAGIEATGVTRTQIARRVGMTRDTVWRYATGSVRRPSLDFYLRLKQLEKSVGADRLVGQKTR
jgi:transcriptional regulator with XRE-family HTH domain